MLATMNRISMPRPRRVWLLMMLIVASARVLAGVPDIDIDDHASETHTADFGLVSEHGYDVSHDGDSTGSHFHCHNCCAHAPMAVSSSLLEHVSKAPIVSSVDPIQPVSTPVFTHFRPPRA
jgi:hypothetical protein